MAYALEESGAQFFSRYANNFTNYNIDSKLFPNLKSNDIVEIYGESGSGKTELLYHFIACCILPENWNGLRLGGSDLKVIFMDNDCHFDLLRLITILETRVKVSRQPGLTSITSDEISAFISERIKLFEIIKCFDSETFLVTLHSLESLLSLNNDKTVLMIDGMTSFYWSDKMKYHNQHTNLMNLYSQIAAGVQKVSKNCNIPVLATRRRVINSENADKKILGLSWRNSVTWQFELIYETSESNNTMLLLLNATNSSTYQCVVSKKGFEVVS